MPLSLGQKHCSDSFFFCLCRSSREAAFQEEEGGIRTSPSPPDRHEGTTGDGNPLWSLCQQFTFTGLSVAEKASCRAQQASLHISSVNTGPAVTRTYLFEETRKGVLNLYVLLPLQKHTQIHPTASVHALLPLVFNPAGVPLSQHDFLRHFTIKYHGGPTTNRAMFQFRLACKTVYILYYFFHSSPIFYYSWTNTNQSNCYW